MKQKMKKIMSYVLVTLLIMTVLPMNVFASNEEISHANQVHIVVENTTYSEDAGAPWSGALVDKWVTIGSDSTAVTALTEALGSYSIDIQPSYGGVFVNGINGISSKDGAVSSGWMFTLNGVMAQNGISYYTVTDNTLFAGDEIKFMFSLDGGSDLGCDYSADQSLGLNTLSFSEGILSPVFSTDTENYTLTIQDNTSVYVLADIKDISENMIIKVDGNECRKSQKVQISNGSRIEITTQRTIWSPDYTSSSIEEKQYSVLVKKESDIETNNMYNDIMDIVSNSLTDENLVFGNEWNVMTAARAGKLSKDLAEKYYSSVVNKLKESDSEMFDSNATTNARVILALSAIGKDAANVEGYNLLRPLANFDYITNQGINAAAYTLLAINSNDYEIPMLETRTIQTTTSGLINYLLDNEIPTGGWDWYNTNADVDLTATVLQALAPYKNDAHVNEAIQRGINVLSQLQNPDGSYSSWGTANPCSIAQVIVALTELSINPNTDDRFIKNGYTAIDALKNFYIPGRGFAYTYESSRVDNYSTVQSSYALVANDRIIKGKNSLYNMQDAFEINNNNNNNNNNNTGNNNSNNNTGNNNSNNNSNNNYDSNRVPQTSDMTNAILFVMLLMISGMIVVFYAGKKLEDER